VSLRQRLHKLEARLKGSTAAKPSLARTCQGCGSHFPVHAPLSEEEFERLDYGARFAAYLAGPDPRDLPCPSCGQTRPVRRAEDLCGKTAEEIDELLQGERFQVPPGMFDAVPEPLKLDVYHLLLRRGTCVDPFPRETT
jgi:hypothetical protein